MKRKQLETGLGSKEFLLSLSLSLGAGRSLVRFFWLR